MEEADIASAATACRGGRPRPCESQARMTGVEFIRACFFSARREANPTRHSPAERRSTMTEKAQQRAEPRIHEHEQMGYPPAGDDGPHVRHRGAAVVHPDPAHPRRHVPHLRPLAHAGHGVRLRLRARRGHRRGRRGGRHPRAHPGRVGGLAHEHRGHAVLRVAGGRPLPPQAHLQAGRDRPGCERAGGHGGRHRGEPDHRRAVLVRQRGRDPAHAATRHRPVQPGEGRR